MGSTWTRSTTPTTPLPRPDVPQFEHQRHKPQTPLERPREVIVACAPMRSNVNISQIARTASAFAVQQLVLCGNARLISKIARDGAEELDHVVRNSLAPALTKLKADGYRLVGLEQATQARCLYDFEFERRTVVVIGNERLGIPADALALLDDCVEIPVYGMPHSFNAGMATGMVLYEYCRQFPAG